jgi:hypothetical protein
MLPEQGSSKFQCPHCGVLATQRWFNAGNASGVVAEIYNHIFLDYRKNVDEYYQREVANFLKSSDHDFRRNFMNYVPKCFSVATCSSCSESSLWVNKEMKYPKPNSIAEPNADLDEDVKELYLEAASILQDSPKGSTALLRLALQKLLKQVGKNGKNINKDIGDLVAEGLSPKIQKALDLLRVIGNNAVHPGQINLDDNSGVAIKLFNILNFIAEELITKPKELDSLYDDLIPEETQEHIKQRDKVV